MAWLKLIQFFKPAGLLMYFYLFVWSLQFLVWNFRVSFCSFEGTVPLSKPSPDAWSEKGQCLFRRARTFRTARCSPFIAISRNPAPLDKCS
jgi:hypothetical protein